MDVILDSANNYTIEGDPQDVFSAIGAISEYLRQEGRSILSVRVDGAEIAPEQVTERLKDMPTANVARLEIGSEQTAKLVEDCLQGLREYLPELPNICRSLAEGFQGEKPDEGFDPFGKTAAL
ncbi:MAG: hypothetical protein L3K26_05215, partial [Candidatus Hydrogenedentes bacterium]|nr:hypothetical protein [Candidatus Hydrogenedentota bacterium]